jgi:hypothetical protein
MERINNELGIEKEIEIEKKHFYSLQDFLVDVNRCYMNFLILTMLIFWGARK